VTSFKCASGQRLTEEEERFNTHLGKARVISEHTIGMLKGGRFQILKSLPMKITNEKKSVKRILRIIDCCIILHNFLVDSGDDTVPEEWYDNEADDDNSDVGYLVGEYDMAVQMNDDDENDERRRRCIDYFRDMNML
jgi:hypothetical protein